MWTKILILFQICLINISEGNACEVCPRDDRCFSTHLCHYYKGHHGDSGIKENGDQHFVSPINYQHGIQQVGPAINYQHGIQQVGSPINYQHGSFNPKPGGGSTFFGRRDLDRCNCYQISDLQDVGNDYSAKFYGSFFPECFQKHDVNLKGCNIGYNGHLSLLHQPSSTEKTTQTTTMTTTTTTTSPASTTPHLLGHNGDLSLLHQSSSTEKTTQTTTLPTTRIFTTTTTTTSPASTTPHLQSKCSKMDTVLRLAHHNVVKQAGLGCSDGVHGLSENVPIELCGAPPSDQWKRGDKVIDNCSSIQKYSAIASFPVSTGSSSYNSQDGIAGVLTDCNSTYIKIATQDCNNNMQLFSITVNPGDLYSHNADFFYTIKW